MKMTAIFRVEKCLFHLQGRKISQAGTSLDLQRTTQRYIPENRIRETELLGEKMGTNGSRT
jgi:hypothetical protein